MIYHVVRAALAQGATRENLPVPTSKWFAVQGHFVTGAEFVNEATRKSAGFGAKRWFVKDHELFHQEGETFALSNQWSGPVALPIIDQTAARFPQLEISYSEAESSS